MMVTNGLKGTCNCSKPADFDPAENETDFTTKA